jgi:hypothetical protein
MSKSSLQIGHYTNQLKVEAVSLSNRWEVTRLQSAPELGLVPNLDALNETGVNVN